MCLGEDGEAEAEENEKEAEAEGEEKEKEAEGREKEKGTEGGEKEKEAEAEEKEKDVEGKENEGVAEGKRGGEGSSKIKISDLESLCDEVQVMILSELSQKDLCECMLVSRKWYKLIKDKVLNSHSLQQKISERVRTNKHLNVKRKNTTLPRRLEIKSQNSSSVVMATQMATPLIDSEVVLYNMKTGLQWNVDHISSYQSREAKNTFKVYLSDAIMVFHFTLQNDSSLVKVFCLQTHNLIFEENYNNAVSITLDQNSDVPVLVILTGKIEILHFSTNNNFSRIEYGIETSNKMYSKLHYPFLATFEVEGRITSLQMWKLDINCKLTKVGECEDIDNFGEFEEELDNVNFLEGIIFCTSDIIYDGAQPDELLVRMLNSDGQLIKQFAFSNFYIHDEFYVEFISLENNFFIRLDGKLYVFKYGFNELLQKKETSEKDFLVIPDFDGSPNLIFNKHSIGSCDYAYDYDKNAHVVQYKELAYF